MIRVKGIMCLVFSITLGTSGLMAGDTLYIREKNSVQHAFPLSDIRKLDFSGNSLIVTTKTLPEVYEVNNIRLLSFRDYVTAIPYRNPNPVQILQVYPNPADASLYVVYRGEPTSGKDLEILDMLGRVVHVSRLLDNVSIVDVSRLQTGIYTCRLYTGNRAITGKFFKN